MANSKFVRGETVFDEFSRMKLHSDIYPFQPMEIRSLDLQKLPLTNRVSQFYEHPPAIFDCISGYLPELLPAFGVFDLKIDEKRHNLQENIKGVGQEGERELDDTAFCLGYPYSSYFGEFHEEGCVYSLPSNGETESYAVPQSIGNSNFPTVKQEELYEKFGENNLPLQESSRPVHSKDKNSLREKQRTASRRLDETFNPPELSICLPPVVPSQSHSLPHSLTISEVFESAHIKEGDSLKNSLLPMPAHKLWFAGGHLNHFFVLSDDDEELNGKFILKTTSVREVEFYRLLYMLTGKFLPFFDSLYPLLGSTLAGEGGYMELTKAEHVYIALRRFAEIGMNRKTALCEERGLSSERNLEEPSCTTNPSYHFDGSTSDRATFISPSESLSTKIEENSLPKTPSFFPSSETLSCPRDAVQRASYSEIPRGVGEPTREVDEGGWGAEEVSIPEVKGGGGFISYQLASSKVSSRIPCSATAHSKKNAYRSNESTSLSSHMRSQLPNPALNLQSESSVCGKKKDSGIPLSSAVLKSSSLLKEGNTYKSAELPVSPAHVANFEGFHQNHVNRLGSFGPLNLAVKSVNISLLHPEENEKPFLEKVPATLGTNPVNGVSFPQNLGSSDASSCASWGMYRNVKNSESGHPKEEGSGEKGFFASVSSQGCVLTEKTFVRLSYSEEFERVSTIPPESPSQSPNMRSVSAVLSDSGAAQSILKFVPSCSSTFTHTTTEEYELVKGSSAPPLSKSGNNPTQGTHEWTMGVVKLENVTRNIKRPMVLDIKMGRRLYGDDAPQHKKQLAIKKAKTRSTEALGFSFTGMVGLTSEGKIINFSNSSRQPFSGAQQAVGNVFLQDSESIALRENKKLSKRVVDISEKNEFSSKLEADLSNTRNSKKPSQDKFLDGTAIAQVLENTCLSGEVKEGDTGQTEAANLKHTHCNSPSFHCYYENHQCDTPKSLLSCITKSAHESLCASASTSGCFAAVAAPCEAAPYMPACMPRFDVKSLVTGDNFVSKASSSSSSYSVASGLAKNYGNKGKIKPTASPTIMKKSITQDEAGSLSLGFSGSQVEIITSGTSIGVSSSPLARNFTYEFDKHSPSQSESTVTNLHSCHSSIPIPHTETTTKDSPTAIVATHLNPLTVEDYAFRVFCQYLLAMNTVSLSLKIGKLLMAQINEIISLFEMQRLVAFYGSSLLFVVDTSLENEDDANEENCFVRMIDFANVTLNSAVHDDDFLFGLRNLLASLELAIKLCADRA